MRNAGVYSVRSMAELEAQIYCLSQEGYRIISVFQTDNGMFHVVAQEFEVAT